MFKFLKDKIKSAVSSFTKKAEEEIKEEEVIEEEVIEEAKQEEEELLEVEEEPVVEVKASEEEKRFRAEEEKEELEQEDDQLEETAEEIVEEKEPKEPEKETEEAQEEIVEVEEKEVKKAKVPKEELRDYQEFDKTDAEIKESYEEAIPIIPDVEDKTEESSEEVVEEKKEESPKEEEVQEQAEKVSEEESKEEDLEDYQEYDKSDEKIKETYEDAKPITSKPEEKVEEVEEVVEKPEEEPELTEEVIEKAEVKEEKKGFFGKLKDSFTKKTLSEDKFDDIFWDLEVTLLENNVAVEVIEKIKADLREALTSGKVSRLGIEDLVKLSLKKSITELFDVETFDLVEKIKKDKKRPYVIAFIGVNGSGKTTTLAKIANKLMNHDLKVVLAASDTFRAAAIDQLEEHAHNLGVKMISQGYNADPAAVAFDAIEHAKSKGIDVVMIDTAGRLHSNTNLMVELEKVIRVAKPDLKIFIGESITGNDCVEQAKQFDEKVGIDAIILSKADVDEKGGAAISVSYVTGKPIIYLGVGQNYGDLKDFDKHKIIESIGL